VHAARLRLHPDEQAGRMLYVGITNDLVRLVERHSSRKISGFTKDYNCHILVWFECFEDIQSARLFEVRTKKWNRAWKIARIVERNPDWRDLVDTLDR
jgi:putative endonuclease